MHRASWPFIAAAAAALTAACVGELGAPDEGTEGGPGPGIAAYEPPVATLRRLTVAQYKNTVSDLLGEPVALATELEVDTALHGFSTVGASEITISPLAAERYEAAAYELAGRIFDDPARREDFVGCAPASGGDDCARSFLADFGMRAFRRPLSEGEVDALSALSEKVGASLGSGFEGLRYAVAAMLQSPHFLFLVEEGRPDPSKPGRLKLSGFEVAARLSYLLWNSTPDDALLSAAERGDLDTEEGVLSEAERLLDSPRARPALVHFFSEYLGLGRLDGLQKNREVFPQMSETLGVSMRGEIERIFEDTLEREADFREILSARETFVNAELAALYGLDFDEASADDEGFSRATLSEDDPRGGLLATAGILALYAHNTVTSPTLRGKFVRVNLLCQDIPPPPPGVATSLDEVGGEGSGPKTARQKLERHRTDPVCANCHSKMDPLGLGLEHFDAIGAYRETDEGLPLDVTGDVDGVPFDGARELGELLAGSPDVGACVARQFYRYATGHLEERVEEAGIVSLAEAFAASGYRFEDLVKETVTSEAFLYASPPEAR